mgnify:CR=1 FL=1
MKALKVRKSFERFEVEVGDETVECVIDCTDESISACAAKAMKARDEALALDAEKAKTYDRKALDKLARKMAAAIGGVVRDAIGDESYEAILVACGDGVRLRPEQCNLVMVQVFAIVCQAYIERMADVRQSKAAHYLQDVADDAQKSDQE